MKLPSLEAVLTRLLHSIYSSAWLKVIAPDRSNWQNFGWSTVINSFYLPGALYVNTLKTPYHTLQIPPS